VAHLFGLLLLRNENSMTVRQLGGALGVLGGLVWIARWLLNPESGSSADVMRYAGLALILLGLVCVGLTLVKGQALWLDCIVGLSAPALFWAIYEVVRAELGEAVVFHGVLGVIWVIVGALLVVKGKPRVDDRAQAHA
jgi:hypothetical protein